MPFDKIGTLIVNVSSAGGAYPIPDAVIRVIGVSEENRDIEYSRLTDIDGVSSYISLPAPSRTLSQAPGAPDAPYALYNVEAAIPGYYPKRIYNVPIFEGETTVLPINMIPASVHSGSGYTPRDSLSTYIFENPMLEI